MQSQAVHSPRVASPHEDLSEDFSPSREHRRESTQAKTMAAYGALSWKLLCSGTILAMQIALALFLIEDSARFYTAGGQLRPLAMAVLTEGALIVCALISFREKTWWLLNKAMLAGIVLFVVLLMQENSHSQLDVSNFRHNSLAQEVQALEQHSQGLRRSIAELEARSRVTAAGRLHEQLAHNNIKMQELREQQRTIIKPMTAAEASIMFYFRLGAILLTIILAAYQRSEWRLNREEK